MKNILVLIILTVLLQGCFANKKSINEDVVITQSTPVCSTEQMCNEMWQASEAWVDRYSPQGTDISTDNLIRSESKELGSDDMEIEIRKIKLENGHYKIVIDNICKRSFGSCSIERNNMIAFNQELIKLMPAKAQAAKEKIFNENTDIKQWFDQYVMFINKNDAVSFSGLLHFPVSYVEKDNIVVLSSAEESTAYLQGIKEKFSVGSGRYLKTSSLDIFGKNGRNAYVNVQVNLYDADSALLGAQLTGFHLVKVGKSWQMISAAIHTE